MHLSELKTKHVTELLDIANSLEIEGANRMRKQDLIFAMLKTQAKKGESIFGDGVLEVLPDGFGFLRSPDTSYLAGTDDIYISPSQIRRFNLHTGDTIEGEIRTPKDGERYFALVKVDKVNGEPPENAEAQDPVREPDAAAPGRGDGRSSATSRPRRTSPAASSTSSRRSARASAACWSSSPKSGKTVMLQHIAHAITANHPDVDADRAADRRAARGSDRDAALGARRSGRLDLRRAGHAPRAGRRDGDREGQAPGRAQEGRRDPARLDHPPGARLQHRRAGVGQGADRRRRRQRAAAPEALLRRGAQHRGRRLADHHRHRADRHRLAAWTT